MSVRDWTALPPTPDGYAYEASDLRLRSCRDAGVEVLEGERAVSFGRRATYVPLWAYAACEGTPPGPRRDYALRRGLRDEEFREAVLAAWRLGGGAGAARLVDAEVAWMGAAAPWFEEALA